MKTNLKANVSMKVAAAFIVVLAAAIAICCSVFANAEEVNKENADNPYAVVITDKTASGELATGITWDATNAKLTLNNATLAGGIYVDTLKADKITVDVQGTNQITGPDTSASTEQAPQTFGSAGIMSNKSMSIVGSGNVSFLANKANPQYFTAYNTASKTYGIYCVGVLDINGPKIATGYTAGATAGTATFGVYVNGKFNVHGTSTSLIADCAPIDPASTADTKSIGINIEGLTNISDGANVSASSKPSKLHSCGMLLTNTTLITGAGTKVVATGTDTTNTDESLRGGSYGLSVNSALYGQNEEDPQLIISAGATVVAISGKGGVYSDGIFSAYKTTITGSGTNVKATGGQSVHRDSNGFEIYDNELYVLDGAYVEGNAGQAARYSEGIYVEYGFTISGAGTVVKGKGGKSTATAEEFEGRGGSFGLDTNQNEVHGDFVISDGATVNAVAGESYLNSVGLYSFYDDLVIKNATVNAVSGNAATLNSSGITTMAGQVIISDGSNVTAYAGDAYLFSMGIESHYDITMTGANTKVKSTACVSEMDESIAISSEDGDVIIENGATVEAVSGKGAYCSLAIWALHNVKFAGSVNVSAKATYDKDSDYCTAITAEGDHLEGNDTNTESTTGDFIFDPNISNFTITNCKELDAKTTLDEEMTQADFSKPLTVVTKSGDGGDTPSSDTTTGSSATGDNMMMIILIIAGIVAVGAITTLVVRKKMK